MAGAEPRRGRGSSGIRSRGGVARFNGHGVFGWFLGMPSLVLSSTPRGKRRVGEAREEEGIWVPVPRPCGSLPHWSSLPLEGHVFFQKKIQDFPSHQNI